MADQDGRAGVARRRVFYIPGYDPIPPRRYRELYRREAASQAAVSGYGIALAPRPAATGFGWGVQGAIEGAEVWSEIEVLVWSDIVQDSMSQSIGATYGQLLRTAWVYCASGALWRLMRLRKGPVIAALYPVVFLLVQLALALGVAAGTGVGVARGLAAVLPWPIVAAGLGWICGGGAAWAVLAWFKARDGKVFAHYLMHDYAFSARGRGANPPALEARMAEFRDRIAAALEEPWDEVLIVGHSSGAHLAVSVLADLLRAGEGAGQAAAGPGSGERRRPALAFLSLGQVVPMVSFLPEAWRLRADLAWLSAHPDLTWVDVSAPGDGCAFALCDPVAVTGVAPEGKIWPLVLSAAFTQTLSPARWKALRWRFFRLHFQYLCAFDQPGDYDYFRITAGPQTLAGRFAGRAPSQSRLTEAVSKYRSVAPR